MHFHHSVRKLFWSVLSKPSLLHFLIINLLFVKGVLEVDRVPIFSFSRTKICRLWFCSYIFQTNLLHMLRRTSEKCGKSTNPIIICRIKATGGPVIISNENKTIGTGLILWNVCTIWIPSKVSSVHFWMYGDSIIEELQQIKKLHLAA